MPMPSPYFILFTVILIAGIPGVIMLMRRPEQRSDRLRAERSRRTQENSNALALLEEIRAMREQHSAANRANAEKSFRRRTTLSATEPDNPREMYDDAHDTVD